MRAIGLVDRRHRLQIGVDRVGVRARHFRVRGKRHCRVEQRTVARLARVHHAVELVGAPLADTGCLVRRDIGRVERAERRLHRAAAAEQLARRHRVAGDAVAGAFQIFAASNDVGTAGCRVPRFGAPYVKGRCACATTSVFAPSPQTLPGGARRPDPVCCIGKGAVSLQPRLRRQAIGRRFVLLESKAPREPVQVGPVKTERARRRRPVLLMAR